jgi:sulfatase maturation enzyme AslB (radical SAM superfamily)
MFYLTNYILIRKEHFGTVIFLPSLQKYVIDNKFFKLFPYFKKGTDFPPLLRNFSSFSKNELSYFIQSLLKYRILITKKNIPSTIRIITNKFVSKDCLSFPRAVYLECTNRCNYNCIFCYQGEKLEKKDFDLFLLRKLTKEMKRYGTSFVSIGGGEPLLYPFLFQAIQEIQEKGIQTEIVTNGSLFNKTNIKQLKATGLRFVQVSLDSSNEKTYLILRKGGNFKKVIKNIEMLTKEGFEVCISMVLTKLNFKEIDKVIELSKKLGAA